MAERMRRTQVLLPEDLYRRLVRRAKQRGRSLGSLVREAMEKYDAQPSREERLAGIQRIARMQLPVPATWEELEESIVAGRGEPCRG